MLLKILGSGTCAISLKRSSPSNYLRIGDKQALVDCGPGTLLQMEKAGLACKDIDMVFLTHFHADHISDLNALVWAYKWGGFNRSKDLHIIGPPGLKRFFDAYIKPLVWDPPAKEFNVVINEITGLLDFKNFSVESCKTPHTEESIAYKFSENARTLVISGDTDYSDMLVQFATGCNVLMLECSFGDSIQCIGHLTPEKCGKIAEKGAVEKLIITHLYPVSSDVERLKAVKRIFKNTVLAEDLMEVLV